MTFGPIEFLVVRFPGNQFRGEIVPALVELVESGAVRIIDLVFVFREGDAAVSVVELADLDPEVTSELARVIGTFDGLLAPEDIAEIATTLEPNSSAALILFENSWATRFVDAMRRANGELVLNTRIPPAAVEATAATGSI